MEEGQILGDILDNIVTDIQKEYPDKGEFEAAFMAIQIHMTVLVQIMAMAGMRVGNLNERELYMICSSLVETCQWMAAKQLAADTMRQIENL